jgi:hypothetical protein
MQSRDFIKGKGKDDPGKGAGTAPGHEKGWRKEVPKIPECTGGMIT